MEQDSKNNSGVPSSPESNRSEGLCFSAAAKKQSITSMPTSAYYSEPIVSQDQIPQHQDSPPPMTSNMDHAPLTSPSSESMTSPKVLEAEENFFPAVHMTTDNLSSNPSECPAEEDKFKTEKYDNDMEYDRELGIPQINSKGKVKIHKCKHCPYVATTKLDFWKHIKIHMKVDRILKCPKCPFVTERKQHLKCHMRNHDGSKPYKCSQCDYSCVNNSMLNSHKKSHSTIYQFRCANCEYRTKYCHSLKLHLRKLKHSPAMVLNADGTPNPLQVIDVYGTRRGPKLKPQSQKPTETTTSNHKPIIPFPFNPLMPNGTPSVQDLFPALFPIFPDLQDPRVLENLKTQKPTETTTSNPESIIPFPFNPLMPSATPSVQNLFPALFPIFSDLQDPRVLENLKRLVHESLGAASESSTSKTTMQAEPHALRITENEVSNLMTFNVEPLSNDESSKMNPEVDIETVTNDGNQTSCQFCDLTFGDPVMYDIHMYHHGINNPFTCNMCGEKCVDRLAFYVHIARQSHM